MAAKTATQQPPKDAATPATTPTDQLIAAMARLVDDRVMAPRIRHLFLSQNGTNLQVSLDMHAPEGD